MKQSMSLKDFFEKPAKTPSPRPTLNELLRDTRFIVYAVLFTVAAACIFFVLFAKVDNLASDLCLVVGTVLFGVCAWYFLGLIRRAGVRRGVRIGVVIWLAGMLFGMGMLFWFQHIRFLL